MAASLSNFANSDWVNAFRRTDWSPSTVLPLLIVCSTLVSAKSSTFEDTCPIRLMVIDKPLLHDTIIIQRGCAIPVQYFLISN